MIATHRLLMVTVVFASMAIGPPRARAVHFRVELTVESTRATVQAPTDPNDRPDTYRPTPIMDVQQDEPLLFQFVMTCLFPHGMRKNTGIHYWISRQADDATPQTINETAPTEDEAGKATVDEKAFPLDGHFLVNCKLQDKVGLRQRVWLHDPGTYLVRVQSEHSSSDHEHSSQMLLRVHGTASTRSP